MGKITETELKLLLNEKLCDMADALMLYYDPCGIRDSACKGGDPNPCCVNSQFGRGGCPFMRDGKCNFRNCDCKLWLCETAVKAADPKCIEALKMLEHFAKLFGLVRSPLIGERYSGADKQPK